MTHLLLQQRNVGFYSDFNLILASLLFYYKNEIEEFNVYWTNNLYQKHTVNLFDKYFFKNKKICQFSNQFDIVQTAADVGYDVYKAVTSHNTFVELYNVLKHYNYFENEQYINCKQKCTAQSNSLGVHIRGTDHIQHGQLLPLSYYFQEIDKKLKQNKRDVIFLATDEEKTIEQFALYYKDSVIYNQDIRRSNTDNAIHYSRFKDKEKLIYDVMRDAISLSLCDEILITSSNVSAHAVTLNPSIQYSYIDKHIVYK
jgi:hypothetical protein